MSLAKWHPMRGNVFDGLAIGVSFACLVHCLALPVLIALLPAWSAWLDLPETFHVWVLMFAVPFSLVVLLRAAQGQLWYRPLWMGIAGLIVMWLGLGLGSPMLEAGITSAGAALLASAHLLNWRQRARCSF